MTFGPGPRAVYLSTHHVQQVACWRPESGVLAESVSTLWKRLAAIPYHTVIVLVIYDSHGSHW